MTLTFIAANLMKLMSFRTLEPVETLYYSWLNMYHGCKITNCSVTTDFPVSHWSVNSEE